MEIAKQYLVRKQREGTGLTEEQIVFEMCIRDRGWEGCDGSISQDGTGGRTRTETNDRYMVRIHRSDERDGNATWTIHESAICI